MEQELTAQMQAWWRAHPKATLTEIEVELDRLVAELRAAALAATLTTAELAVTAAPVGAETCAVCGMPLVKSGRRKRKLKTKGEQELELEREYLCCPRCGWGFFPLRP